MNLRTGVILLLTLRLVGCGGNSVSDSTDSTDSEHSSSSGGSENQATGGSENQATGGSENQATGGSENQATGGSPGDEIVDIEPIEREPLPESRFKPKSLETTINALVNEINDATVSKRPALGVVLKALTGFWRGVAIGANRAIGEAELVGSVMGTTQETLTVEEEIAEQIQFVVEHQSLKTNGLAIAPQNNELLPHIENWIDGGRPVITIESDLPTSGRALYIGADYAQDGVTAGETLVTILGGSTGRVLVLGNTDPAWAEGFERTEKAAEVIEAAGNEVEVLNSLWVPDDEVAQIVAAMSGGSGAAPIVGMIGMFPNSHTLATAMLQVDPEVRPTIVAFDLESETLDYMEAGVIAATHTQRTYYMGYLSVYLLYSIHVLGLDKTKETIAAHMVDGDHVDTGLDVIRAEELAEYNAYVDDLGI